MNYCLNSQRHAHNANYHWHIPTKGPVIPCFAFDIRNLVFTPQKLMKKLLYLNSDRDCFTKAVDLQPGEIYTSPLGLNREYGKTDIPRKPVIRFAKLV